MNWEKKGLVYRPDPSLWWSQKYGIIPTPVFLEEKNIIRVYFASTDKDLFGRIAFIDLSADDPSVIVSDSKGPVMDIGEAGAFDDCGVNPSCVVKQGDKTWLFYIGYHRSQRVPYSILAGKAIIKENEIVRTSRLPVLERTEEELNIRSATTMLFEDGIYKMWYVGASGWMQINNEVYGNKTLPRYVIRYATSADLIKWEVQKDIAVNYEDPGEFGFGRPWVVKEGGIYKMWYSIRRTDRSYRIGYAESADGIKWDRMDHKAGIDVSPSGWDSEMICYPAVITVKNKTYLFYNGNNNGATGFGYAILRS